MRNLWIFFLVVIAAACGKTPSVKDIYIPADIKAKYNFKKGIYWIYKDSKSGRSDSFFVIENKNNFSGGGLGEPYRYEYLDLRILQKNNLISNDSISWYFNLSARYKTLPSLGAGYYHKYLDSISMFATFGTYNMLTNQSFLTVDYWTKALKGSMSMLSSYSSHGQSFDNVAYIRYNEPDTTRENVYYFNDSVGYIKMDMKYQLGNEKIHEVWELQRWHIVK